MLFDDNCVAKISSADTRVLVDSASVFTIANECLANEVIAQEKQSKCTENANTKQIKSSQKWQLKRWVYYKIYRKQQIGRKTRYWLELHQMATLHC